MLAGEGGLGGVLGGGAGADRHRHLVPAQPPVGGARSRPPAGPHRGRAAAGGQRLPVGGGGDGEPGRDPMALADQVAEPDRLPADQRRGVGAALLQPEDVAGRVAHPRASSWRRCAHGNSLGPRPGQASHLYGGCRTGAGPVVPWGGAVRDRGRRLPGPGAGQLPAGADRPAGRAAAPDARRAAARGSSTCARGRSRPRSPGSRSGWPTRWSPGPWPRGPACPWSEVRATLRETGDLGLTAEQLLAGHGAGDRRPPWRSGSCSRPCTRSPPPPGPAPRAASWSCWAACWSRATPLEARYLARTVTGSLRLGVGTPTILDALALVHTGSRASRPVLERAYNICSRPGPGRGHPGPRRPGRGGGDPGPGRQPGPADARPADERAPPSCWPSWAGRCGAEYKYDGVRLQAHRTADGRIELFTRRLERVAGQFPDVVELLDGGLGPREAILEGEVVAADPVSGELRPFQEVMHRRRKHGIAEAIDEWPVSLYCFDLLYADGEDLTRLPYPRAPGPAGAAVTPSPRLRLATAAELDDPEPPGAVLRAGHHRRLRGAAVQVAQPDAGYQAGARGWLWIKLKRDYRTELQRHPRPGGGRRPGRPGPAPRRLRGAAAGRLRRRGRPVPDRLQVRHRLQRRRAGRPARAAGALARPGDGPPARVDAPHGRPTSGSSPAWWSRSSGPS